MHVLVLSITWFTKAFKDMGVSQTEYLRCKSMCKPVSRVNGSLISPDITGLPIQRKCLSKWLGCRNHSKLGVDIGTYGNRYCNVPRSAT